jgi:hypothetical protein
MLISPAFAAPSIVLNIVNDFRTFSTVVINLLENKLAMSDILDEFVSLA